MTGTPVLVGRRVPRRMLRRIAVLIAGAAAIGVVVAVAVRTTGAVDPAVAIAVPLLLIAAASLFFVPVHVLPAIALAGFSLVPMRLVPSDGPFNAVPPMTIILAIWVFRRVVLGQRAAIVDPVGDRDALGPRYIAYVAAILLLVWALISTAMSGWSETSVGWTASFAIGALSVLLVFDARAEARVLLSTWIVLGGVLGAYAVVELVLQASPLFDAVYAVVGGASDNPWSVYRAEASFSHPLFAATYFTVAAALGIGSWLSSSRVRDLVFGCLAAVGVAATVSRGAILAAAIAIVVIGLAGLLLLGRRAGNRIAALIGIAVVGAIALLNFQPLAERQDSIESTLSAGARDLGFDVAMRAAAYSDWLGTGPGTSGITGRIFDEVVIENSALQILISMGIPGLLLFAALLGALVVCAARHRNVAAIGAIVGFSIVISSFNAIDAVRSMHLLLGLLVILAVHAPTPWVPRILRGASATARPRIRAERLA